MDIVELVSQYRTLKTQADDIKAKMDDIKGLVEPLVLEHGNWQDAEGYAKRIAVSSSFSFDAKSVTGLMEAWLLSEDAIMQSCGKMLQSNQKAKDGYSYITIK